MEIEQEKTRIDNHVERKIQAILYTCMINEHNNWYWFCRFNYYLYRCNFVEEGLVGEIELITTSTPVPVSDSRVINQLDREYENYIWIPEVGIINIDTGRRVGAERNRSIDNAFFECAESLKALSTTNLTQPKERRKTWR